MNFEGLRRRGFGPERIAAVKAMHKALYRSDLSLEQSIQAIEALGNPQTQGDVGLMLDFLRLVSPQRGIVR
jgi:UDP-N-acetylglucosamine acyltransferase